VEELPVPKEPTLLFLLTQIDLETVDCVPEVKGLSDDPLFLRCRLVLREVASWLRCSVRETLMERSLLELVGHLTYPAILMVEDESKALLLLELLDENSEERLVRGILEKVTMVLKVLAVVMQEKTKHLQQIEECHHSLFLQESYRPVFRLEETRIQCFLSRVVDELLNLMRSDGVEKRGSLKLETQKIGGAMS
jgi:hypothetical protein